MQVSTSPLQSGACSSGSASAGRGGSSVMGAPWELEEHVTALLGCSPAGGPYSAHAAHTGAIRAVKSCALGEPGPGERDASSPDASRERRGSQGAGVPRTWRPRAGVGRPSAAPRVAGGGQAARVVTSRRRPRPSRCPLSTLELPGEAARGPNRCALVSTAVALASRLCCVARRRGEAVLALDCCALDPSAAVLVGCSPRTARKTLFSAPSRRRGSLGLRFASLRAARR